MCQHTFTQSAQPGYIVCSRCGTFHSTQFGNPSDLYNNDYWSHERGHSTITEQVYNVTHHFDSGAGKNDKVMQYVPASGAAVLEIACAPGELLKRLAQRFTKVYGIEVDPKYEADIRAVSNGKAELLFGLFPEVTKDFAPASLDCIIALDVFEHVPDGDAFIRECQRLLKPGGTLILMSPFIYADGVFEDKMYHPVEHVWLYSDVCLKEAFSEQFDALRFERWFPGHEIFVCTRKGGVSRKTEQRINKGLACFATTPDQRRALDPIAAAFPGTLVSSDIETVEAMRPGAIVVACARDIAQFRPFCSANQVALIALSHGTGREYALADYICGSAQDEKEFCRQGIVPLKQFVVADPRGQISEVIGTALRHVSSSTHRLANSPPAALVKQVEAAIAAGDLDGARTALIAALAHEPHHLDLICALANVNVQRGDRPGAHTELMLALTLDPDCVTALTTRAGLLIDENRLDEAKQTLEHLSQLRSDDDTIRQALQQLIASRQTAPPVAPVTNDNRYDRIPCPFCASEDAEPVRTAADIVRCRGCGTVYLRTRMKQEAMEQLYQSYVDDGSHLKLPANADAAAASPWKRDYFLREVLDVGGKPGPLLDVGCSWGAFLLGAREHGFQPMGIELTRKAVRFANETLGIPVANTQFLDTPIPSNALQAVTMIHVLEHLPQPKPAIVKVFNSLQPGGVFCGIVPNMDSYCSQRQGDQWYWLDPNYHYVHYTPATLRRHLEAAGFEVVRMYTTRGDYDPELIRKVAGGLDDAALAKLMAEQEATGQGEELRFFARKPLGLECGVLSPLSAGDERHSSDKSEHSKSDFTLPMLTFPWPASLDPYVCRHDGKFVYLGEKTFERLDLLAAIEPFYFQCGGAGDALLLMAAFYDQHPNGVVVSYPNSLPAMRSFFEAFPLLEKVYFLPQHADLKINEFLRARIPQLSSFRGMGVTPRTDYAGEWTGRIDVFRDYGVIARPQWAQRFAVAKAGKQVAVAPQGSLVGMAGTKRNIIEPVDWPELIRILRQQGYQPVIIGTPSERETYPCPDGCEDRRSFSFREQMEQIASSALFVGADSWGKTFAALAGVPTIVFEAIKSVDWRGVKDPSDYIFLDPWDNITVISGLEHLQDILSRNTRSRQECRSPERAVTTVHVAWEGSFTDHGSLSHVNRELTSALVRQPQFNVTRVGDGHRAQAPARSQVTVRHAWPPNWERPKHGAWVLIQPWEFGALPAGWMKHLAKIRQVWVPSEYVRRVYVDSGVEPGKVKVVPNGIDPKQFHPDVTPLALATKKSFNFLFVGGTIHRKGPDLLLKAYLENFTAVDDVCLVIKDFGGQSVYAGQTFEAQIKEAQSRPDAPEILYLNEDWPAEKLPALYVACDCLVHPYRGEGFALPVLEAMACGLPVIVTAGGATDDFASDEYAYRISATRQPFGYQVGPFHLIRKGWLLEPSLPELAERMRWVAAHRNEAKAKGRAASEYARREWTWDRAAAIAAGRLQELATRPQPQSSAITLPACAWLGQLPAQADAVAARAALAVRPFHPPAEKLLKRLGGAGAVANAPRLSVCLITKNEEQFLAQCLQSVKEIAWQIVMVDTGSTDRTKAIAQEFGAEVYDFKWCDDFSAARNTALEHARGDWVLVLDADEELTAEGRAVLLKEIQDKKVLAYRLPIVDVGREDEGCSYVPRLFRNAPGLFYVGRIHEQVFTSIEVRRKEWQLENKLSAATLRHHGYTAAVAQARNKNARNLHLLEKALQEFPGDPNLLMNFGLELARAGRAETALEQYVAAYNALAALPVEEITPELREALLTQLCAQLVGAKEFGELVKVLQSPLAKQGKLSASLHFAWGLALMELKQFKEAIEQFRQCLAMRDKPALTPINKDIRKAAPHHCLAICLRNLKQREAAGAAFQAAMAADPLSRPVRLDYAVFLGECGLGVEALKVLQRLLEEKADDLPAWLLGGTIALSQPEFVEFACDWTGEALKNFPTDKLLHRQRARALLATGQADEAAELWRQSVAAAEEPRASQEFLNWYRLMLAGGGDKIVQQINADVAILRKALPSAAKVMEAAMAEAGQVARV